MEVDILNDILLRTVSNLFSNKSKHISYFSDDDTIIDKQEIFSQNNPKNEKKSYTYNNNKGEQKQNIIEKIINNNMQKNPQINQGNISPKNWCMTIGKKKYEESLNRLQINETIIASRTLINEMNLDQLIHEKARVKQELKKYDEDFIQVFKVKPTKENKEIMKPLYYYYQKLKIAIKKKSPNQQDGKDEGNEKSNINIHPSTLSVTTYTHDTTLDNSKIQQQSTMSHNPSNNTYQQRINSTGNMNSIKSSNNSNNSVNTNTVNNNNTKTYNIFHKKANSGGGIVNQSNKNKNEEVNLNQSKGKRSLSKEEINALEKEYFTIKAEQNSLTQMLRDFQNEFQKTNNRKVKWTKDIKPVEKEYNRYKVNKERIKQIKELFGHLENNNNK